MKGSKTHILILGAYQGLISGNVLERTFSRKLQKGSQVTRELSDFFPIFNF
jgi:hypothetical protein